MLYHKNGRARKLPGRGADDGIYGAAAGTAGQCARLASGRRMNLSTFVERMYTGGEMRLLFM